jgi:hypothetical protein
MVRLNIDVAAGRFQKEGFAARPILEVSASQLILLRVTTQATVLEVTLDRLKLVYTAQSEDRVSKAVSRTQYQCIAGSPFEVSERN